MPPAAAAGDAAFFAFFADAGPDTAPPSRLTNASTKGRAHAALAAAAASPPSIPASGALYGASNDTAPAIRSRGACCVSMVASYDPSVRFATISSSSFSLVTLSSPSAVNSSSRNLSTVTRELRRVGCAAGAFFFSNPPRLVAFRADADAAAALAMPVFTSERPIEDRKSAFRLKRGRRRGV